MATAVAKQLSQSVLSKTLTTLYTPPSTDAKAIIKEIILCNVGTIATSVTIYIVSNGDTPSLSNIIINNLCVDIGKTVLLSSMTTVLEPGATVQAIATNNQSLNITISGAEII